MHSCSAVKVLNFHSSFRLNGHFPGGPGLAVVYWSKGWWKWWWQFVLQVVQSSSQIITTNKTISSFLQAGCPSCHPTNSIKALKGKYHIPWPCLPQAHLGVFQLCLWPLHKLTDSSHFYNSSTRSTDHATCYLYEVTNPKLRPVNSSRSDKHTL